MMTTYFVGAPLHTVSVSSVESSTTARSKTRAVLSDPVPAATAPSKAIAQTLLRKTNVRRANTKVFLKGRKSMGANSAMSERQQHHLARKARVAAAIKMKRGLAGFVNPALERQYLCTIGEKSTSSFRRTLAVLLVFFIFRLLGTVVTVDTREPSDRWVLSTASAAAVSSDPRLTCSICCHCLRYAQRTVGPVCLHFDAVRRLACHALEDVRDGAATTRELAPLVRLHHAPS